LAKTEYGDGLLLFNGSNTDERSKRIYANWSAKHKGTDRVTGSRTADMRSALVDYFREEGNIMIATEAGAEGINLQFCSLLVNYDLPWNPQRIEQRIGRCHRYGQQHDVVVLNFVNRANAADERVFQLLNEKFKLFEGVFGASDEVLGALESGVDIERRIADIFQKCRTKDEIKTSFDALQLELQFEIGEAMKHTRQQLIEHFDDEVRDKLVMNGNRTEASLNRYQQLLMRLSSYELADYATFDDERRFTLHTKPYGLDVLLGEYELPQLDPQAHDYRLGTPLAEQVVKHAKDRATPMAEVVFDLTGHEGNVTVLNSYKGQRGLLTLQRVTIESMDTAEDHVLLAGHTAVGEVLAPDVLQELFRLGAAVGKASAPTESTLLEQELKARKEGVQREVNQRNLVYYEAEATKLDGWAEDQKIALERDIKELDKQIREMRRTAAASPTLEEKLGFQKKMRTLEQDRTLKRRELFEAQDTIDRRRDELIATIEGKLEQRVKEEEVFTVNWHII